MRGIQDMLSSFYNLLEAWTNLKFKVGSNIKMNVWIDDESYPFYAKSGCCRK